MDVELNYSQLCELVDNFKDIKITKPQKCLFNSISDLYYRENFHSDILAYYLSYDLVKKKLIDWINRYFKENTPGKWIDFSLYKGGPDPKREEGRRDITIYSKDKKHVIIIENKSNGAGDMPYQIPRYYLDLREKCVVDAIVYLNKEYYEWPRDIQNWDDYLKEKITDDDGDELVSNIKKKLVISTLDGQNAFTENVIGCVLLDNNDIRLSGLSLELQILFENIVNGECGMSDLDYDRIIEEYGSKEGLNFLNNCRKILEILPEKIGEYYSNKVKKEYPNPPFIHLDDSKNIFFDFGKEGDEYYVQIGFNQFWDNIIKFQYAVREPLNENWFKKDPSKYTDILNKLKKIDDLNLKYEDMDENGFITYVYKPKKSINADLVGEIQSIIKVLENNKYTIKDKCLVV